MPEPSRYSTGDPRQDRILGKKLEELGLQNGNEDVPEVAVESADVDPRARRLAIEDEVLAKDPRQRKSNILDFVRRGRLLPGIEIMPEVIQVMPALLESGLIDFTSAQYSESETITALLKNCDAVKLVVLQQDDLIRSKLATHGAMVESRKYMNSDWYKKLTNQLATHKKMIDQPNPRHPSIMAGKPDEYRHDVNERFVQKLEATGIKPAEQLVNDYLENDTSIQVDFPVNASVAPVEQFILDKCANNFFHFPTQAEYEGPIVQGPPGFETMKVKLGIRVIERDTVPEEAGGVIFDGNFGYDESGRLIKPDDKYILDHHDALNEKQYDTATVMASRFWQERLGRKFNSSSWKDELEKLRAAGIIGAEGKKLVTMVNDPDVDAMIGVWVFRNPRKAAQYAELLNNISFCGDFLTGSRTMEFGANARDYNYIVMNYLEACKEKIKQERLIGIELRKAEMESQRAGLRSQLDTLNAQREGLKTSDPTVSGLVAALDAHKRKNVVPAERRVWSEEMKSLTLQLEQSLDEALDPDVVSERALVVSALKEADGQILDIEKQVKSQKNAPLTSEDEAKIVSHFLNIMEDIIRNPFKYQKFLRQGREQEERGLNQVEQWYRDGEIEITTSESDPNVLIMRPLKGKSMPRGESIDGLYFYLRKRIDFNRKIIVNLDGASFMVAINTQNQAELKDYDFNELVPEMRVREEILLKEQLTAKQAELAAADPAKRAGIEKEVARVNGLIKRNREGRLWRNRNQMAFVFRSAISESEYLGRVQAWKGLEDEKLAIDAQSAEVVNAKVQEYVAQATENADRVSQLGAWPSTGDAGGDHEQAMEALVGRIPNERKGKFAGFDAGVACTLNLIPPEKQKLSAELHVRYTPEAVERILADTKDILNIDPDSEAAWWLAACSLCQEGDIDQKAFLKQLVAFERLRTNPQSRREAAIVEYRKMVGLFKMEKFQDPDSGEEVTVPFTEEDGGIQGAYLEGRKFAVSHLKRENGSEWYEIGSYEESLGLEDFPWTGTYRRNGRDYPNGPQYGTKNFFRVGDKNQVAKAIAVISKAQKNA